MLLTSLEQNTGSSVDKNTLLHGESIFVVSSSDFEKVALESWAHVLSLDLSTHSLVEERSAKENTPKSEMPHILDRVHLHILFIINFNFLCYPSFWAGNVELCKENQVSKPPRERNGEAKILSAKTYPHF